MRATFTILLFIAVFGLVFSSHAADAPVAGVDYDIRPASAFECRSEDTPGDSWLGRTAGTTGHRARSADVPAPGIKLGYQKMMCLLLDH